LKKGPSEIESKKRNFSTKKNGFGAEINQKSCCCLRVPTAAALWQKKGNIQPVSSSFIVLEDY
jgi:hypothetical protein